MRTDPFREVECRTQQVFGQNGTRAQPAAMPMDAYREEERYVVALDLPGIDPEAIDLHIERNVLTVRAERTMNYGDNVELRVAERPRGVFSRQLLLGDTLDTDRIEAHYDAGVLTLRIPVSQKAKTRKIDVSTVDGTSRQFDASNS